MRRYTWGAALVLLGGGCAQVLGLGDFAEDDDAGTGGTTQTTTTGPGSPVSGSGTGTPASGSTSTQGNTTGTGDAQSSSSTGPFCGDGVVDAGEKCDGDCPTECVNPDFCVDQKVTGDAAMCSAECLFEPLIACKSWDGCCPSGCFFGNDNDCDQRVAVIAGDQNTEMDLTNALEATGAFDSVATFNLPFATPAASYPTLTDLQAYSAVIVYTFSSFADPAAMGNVLADYVDWGGRVVLTAGANCADQYRLRGRWEADGYFLNDEGGVLTAPVAMMTADEPMSPLLVGVGTPTLETHCDIAPAGATTVVATLADGTPMVLRGVRNGRMRVDLNLYPPTDYFDSEVMALMVNAMKYPRD